MMLPAPSSELCLARSQLAGDDRDFYDKVVAGLTCGSATVTLSRFDPTRALEVFMLVMCDHPEFYWAACSARSGGFGDKLRLTTYLAPDRQVEATVMSETNRILSAIPASCSDYMKAKTIFGEVGCLASYDYSDQASDSHMVRSHSLWGVFADGLAVCDGFASALQFLMQQAGVLAYRLTGTACSSMGTGPHSWVLARIDGDFYHIDPTWGAMALGESARCRAPLDVDFDYLCLTDKDVAQTHFPDALIAVPACTAKASNYYRKEGYYLQMWDESAIVDAIVRQLASGRSLVSLRAATRGVYDRLVETCEDGNKLYRILEKAWSFLRRPDALPNAYQYSMNEALRTVKLFNLGNDD